ncbi:MAG: peptide deformylase [Candidatus Paceibacterota bacterium]
MPISKIVQEGEGTILRKRAKDIKESEIGSETLSNIIQKMKDVLALQDDGVAIAAPQIGESLRVFVVSGKVYDQLERSDQPELDRIDESRKKRSPDKTFINPEIIKTSKETLPLDEGCLSVRHYYGQVLRHSKVTVRALDEEGNAFTEGRSGLLAQIFQHETDHLNGVLFIDKAKKVDYRAPKEKNETK